MAAYLVASRQGLYRADRDGWRRLAAGTYFGLACAGDEVFAFRHGPGSGSIVRFSWRSGELVERGAVVEGLDPGCHQLDRFDGAFFLVDTLHQAIREYDGGWRPAAVHRLLPPAARDSAGHAHLNSIAGHADRVWVLFHNGQRGRPSEIVEYDRNFGELGRTVLPCSGCHDIVPLPDGRLLTCLSPLGAFAAWPGEPVKVDNCWTRGLVAAEDEIAVGSSYFGKRAGRALLPGFLTFFAPDFHRNARLYLPAAPTQIRRIADG